MQRVIREAPGFAGGRAEEGGLAVAPYAGGLEMFIQELLELVVDRHLVALAAFLMQPEPPALAGRVMVLDPQGHGRTDARKGVDHHTY